MFIIDDANELRSLLHENDGRDALHIVFKWFILNTKEIGRFHVIFASSDSGWQDILAQQDLAPMF